MTRRDKIGAVVLVALFVVLLVVLVVTFSPRGQPIPPEESVFVQQRIKNLQKSTP